MKPETRQRSTSMRHRTRRGLEASVPVTNQPDLALLVSVDAERAILGSILLDNSCYAHVAESLSPNDFQIDIHRKIYIAIQAFIESGRPVNYLLLWEALRDKGEVDSVGGAAYLAGLTDGLPEGRDVGVYIRAIRESAKRRAAATVGSDLMRLATDRSVSPSALAEVATSLIVGATSGESQPPRHSEEAIALRFSRKHADDLRFVHKWGRWLYWDGTRWCFDETLRIFDNVRAECRKASTECADAERKDGIRIASKMTVAAVERLAQADRRNAATVDQWDTDPWLLNTPSGTVDLRKGEVHQHRREQYFTKLTATGPGGKCPQWLKFLKRVTGGDAELQKFLQRLAGYCLTGSTREDAFFFLYGTGGNGKSVFLNSLSAILGDYAKTAPASTFTATHTEQHPTDLAGLVGARFVTAMETEDGRSWAEAKIKLLTGGDRIPARFMRGDFFEYVPQFKIIVAGNHKPSLRSVDEAIRRRLRLIPFIVTIPEQERDLDLDEKLQSEYPGILQWAIEGALAWLEQGLNPPDAVLRATTEYFIDEDTIAQWVEERCTKRGDLWTAVAQLYADYDLWSKQRSERPLSKKGFSQTLETRGFVQRRTPNSRGFDGIGLRAMTVVTGRPI